MKEEWKEKEYLGSRNEIQPLAREMICLVCKSPLRLMGEEIYACGRGHVISEKAFTFSKRIYYEGL